MPLATTALNSYAWVATGRTTYAWGEAADYEREWGEAAEALAAAPTPVPYPWNLVGSRRAEDALNWLLEAEKKHGSVASLALANWCALTMARSRRRARSSARGTPCMHVLTTAPAPLFPTGALSRSSAR